MTHSLRSKRDDSIISLLKYYGEPVNRDSYLALKFAGEPPFDEDGELAAEIEAELPPQFRRETLIDAVPLTDTVQ